MPKSREVLRMLIRNGWYVQRQGKGSHVILKHPDFRESISFPDHGSMEIASGTLNKILKKAGLK